MSGYEMKVFLKTTTNTNPYYTIIFACEQLPAMLVAITGPAEGIGCAFFMVLYFIVKFTNV